MSGNKSIIPTSIINEKNENISLNSTPYNDLIDYGSIRKQFSRIIPSYYMNIQKNRIHSNKKFTSDTEEFNKLKNEIICMEESILALKDIKKKKLEQIEELRILMRKAGNKNIAINNKKII